MSIPSPPALPRTFPVFPLTGTLLLPGNWLPLNIFEARYRNMVEDVMQGEPYLGMIQPLVPADDNQGPPEGDLPEDASPRLYEVGCVGRIEECEPSSDGRYFIALVGVSRFRITQELPLKRGYRRVRASYEGFAEDLETPPDEPTPEELISALVAFGEVHKLSFDMRRLRQLPVQALVNGLSMALPFEPAEKQALLEAGTRQRRQVLQTLLTMGVDFRLDGESEPVLH